MWQQLMPAFRITIVFTALTGFVYTAVITGIAQLVLSHEANGSLVTRGGQTVGSELLGQSFSRPEYFRGRPSAAGNIIENDASASGGSNLGPTSQKLTDRIKGDVAEYRNANPSATIPLPADSVTASASGLDPHVSPANAALQVARVAAARGASPDAIKSLVDRHTGSRTLGVLGEPRVNVLALNLALDQAFPVKR
jgi:K+-transporting ATPase ATPase C chain